MDRIPERIKERRTELHISQTKFGREVMNFEGSDNAVQKKVSKLETGDRKLTISELYNIAKYLKKPMEYFIDDNFQEEISSLVNCAIQCTEKTKPLCKEVNEIINSNTHWSGSLEANIHSFKAGLELDREKDKYKAILGNAVKEINELKKIQKTEINNKDIVIKDKDKKIATLTKENESLKSFLPDVPLATPGDTTQKNGET